MSYLRTTKATCGRYVPKPNESDDNPNYEDDTSIPLQDQIDNLRAKISLKEKYNKALQEEVSETNAGAATMITELVETNKHLHEDLKVEINAEKFAVKKALRSYREFQLAVSDKKADTVIDWLDDKIFDASKTLNDGIYHLKIMQNKLQEAENQVYYMESCPVPGSEPWEREAEDTRVNLECAIEATKANKDANTLLNKKYHEILFHLKGEKGKWPHIMASMEKTLAQLRKELSSLEVMLEEAHKFRDEASEKLKLVEEEASANRKQRRQQMSKMKKSVEKALEANTAKYAKDKPVPHNLGVGRSRPQVSTLLGVVNSTTVQQSAQEIKIKQAQVLEYETRGNTLVEAMRVPDLRYCPKRLSTVRRVTEVLSEEHRLKEEIKQFLLSHKYRLALILEHFRYTGSVRDEKFIEDMIAIAEKKEDVQREINEKKFHINKTGSICAELQLSMTGIEELFNQGKKKAPPHVQHEDLRITLKKILEKVKNLVDVVDKLRKEFPEDSKPLRSYAPYVKIVIPQRYIRAGGADELELEDDSDQDDLIDSKIPNREEIKAISEKIHAQAKLRSGIK